MKVLCVLGTRPEAIKMAPIVKAMRRQPEVFDCRLCITAQHRQMLDDVLAVFGIQTDYDLDIMRDEQTLSEVTGRVFLSLDPIVAVERPDWLLVQGDTTTAMTASLVAYYHKIKVAHVEAGLRTYDKFEPFPEDVNRRITSLVSDMHFAPTEDAKTNLLNEAVPEDRIHVTGNPVIDALLEVVQQPCSLSEVLPRQALDARCLLLVTAHRRESFGAPLRSICQALKTVAQRYVKTTHIVYPVHPNPNVSGPVFRLLSGIPNVTLVEPLNYMAFSHLLNRSYLVLTDSGGLQEEAPSLGKPVLVLRNTTERPEAVAAGAARLVGTCAEEIVRHVTSLMEDPLLYETMTTAGNPYGDGHAAQRICRALSADAERAMSRRTLLVETAASLPGAAAEELSR
jgi:UDP-N-acetylglucosamine 2-epimerase (non-hydrolysing)